MSIEETATEADGAPASDFVEYTWHDDGPLGLAVVAHGDDDDEPEGSMLLSTPGPPFPETITAGMRLHQINGEDVTGISLNDTMAILIDAGRPLTIVFHTEVQHDKMMEVIPEDGHTFEEAHAATEAVQEVSDAAIAAGHTPGEAAELTGEAAGNVELGHGDADDAAHNDSESQLSQLQRDIKAAAEAEAAKAAAEAAEAAAAAKAEALEKEQRDYERKVADEERARQQALTLTLTLTLNLNLTLTLTLTGTGRRRSSAESTDQSRLGVPAAQDGVRV